jgi:hypothetical protein
MSCSVDMYLHPDKGGLHANVTGTINKFDDARPGGIPNNHVSSFQVNGCNNTVVTACRHDQYHDKGQQCMYLKGYNQSLHWRRKYNDNNWADEWDSIVFTPVPTEDANNMEYNRENNHYTPASPNDGYCGGCRLWPEVKDRNNPANANRDDVWLTDHDPGYKGVRPCPGGNGYFTSGTGVKCIYSKSDARQLETLKNAIGSDSGLSAMYTDLVTKFCNIPDNITKNPGGQTCLERDSGSRIAKEYCKVGDRIKSDGVCTKENLGNFYTELAENFCKTAAGKTDAWCSCYNVMNGVCDTDSTAAGCAKKRQTFDKLVEATPEEYKNSWSQMEPCFGGVCQGNVFQPDGYNANCNRSVQVCVQDFDFQTIADSQINATCNLTSNRDTQPSAGDGTPSYTPSGAPSGTTYPTGSTAAKLDTSFRSKLPEFLRPYVPVSVDEVKTDSSKQLGVGGVGSLFMMCCCCLLVIIVLATSGGNEGGGRSMRFRR